MAARGLIARLRLSSLGVKLAVLGAAVTAAVVVATFWGLGVEVRRTSERVFAEQLERNQKTLHQLQDRSTRQMLLTARLISRAPAVQYSLKTYQLEVNRGGTPSRPLAREIQAELTQLAFDVDAPFLAATDDAGRVFATAGARAGDVRAGTSLGGLRAVQRALDPTAPADSGMPRSRRPRRGCPAACRPWPRGRRSRRGWQSGSS